MKKELERSSNPATFSPMNNRRMTVDEGLLVGEMVGRDSPNADVRKDLGVGGF